MAARKQKPHRVRGLDWNDPDIVEMFGTCPDQEIADLAGVTRERVRQVRSARGIPSFRSSRKNLPDELVSRLGTVRDKDLALEYGIATHYVADARKATGVPAYRTPCGTGSRYNAGCRCDACKAANNERRKDWVTRNPELAAKHHATAKANALASAPHDVETASVGKYQFGCRCEACRVATRKYYRTNGKSWMVGRLVQILKENPTPHDPGSTTWYQYGCRCTGCREAANAKQRDYYRRKAREAVAENLESAVDSWKPGDLAAGCTGT